MQLRIKLNHNKNEIKKKTIQQVFPYVLQSLCYSTAATISVDNYVSNRLSVPIHEVTLKSISKCSQVTLS